MSSSSSRIAASLFFTLWATGLAGVVDTTDSGQPKNVREILGCLRSSHLETAKKCFRVLRELQNTLKTLELTQKELYAARPQAALDNEEIELEEKRPNLKFFLDWFQLGQEMKEGKKALQGSALAPKGQLSTSDAKFHRVRRLQNWNQQFLLSLLKELHDANCKLRETKEELQSAMLSNSREGTVGRLKELLSPCVLPFLTIAALTLLKASRS
jgi:hypothetical protein